jgi:hypothetical protein
MGAVLGGILAVVAVKTADYVGLGHRGESTPVSILPTTGDVTQPPPPPPSTTSTTPNPRRHRITLVISPTTAASYQRVNLTGSYPGHDGAVLQIQRRLGSGPWSDFPATTHVNGDRFATYIQTGMAGVNHFRMLDETTGAASNVATVTIG